MVEIKITIPNEKLEAIIDAFATQYNYRAEIDGVENPVKKLEFAKNIINSFIKEVYVMAQVKGLDAQRQATIQSASAEVKDISVS